MCLVYIVNIIICVLLIWFLLYRDTSYVVREKVLLELMFWINIDFINFINDFWMYIYWALGDQSTSVQTIALKVGILLFY